MSGRDRRLLAVGGIHLFDLQPPCRLVRVEPAGAVEDLGWADVLALEARGEAAAEVECGAERFQLEIVAPARLDVERVDGDSTQLPAQERFRVRVRLHDRSGRELEVGKSTIFDWSCTGVLEVANDRPAGEFGVGDTAYGMHRFRATRPGTGSIAARLGVLQGMLTITAVEPQKGERRSSVVARTSWKGSCKAAGHGRRRRPTRG